MEVLPQGFSGPAMLPMSELEYTGVTEKREALEKRFAVRAKGSGSSPS
jgi:fructose 1,6-bisphosphate aldolase/phosphatase